MERSEPKDAAPQQTEEPAEQPQPQPQTTDAAPEERPAAVVEREIEQPLEPDDYHRVPYDPPSGGQIFIGAHPETHRPLSTTRCSAVLNLSGLKYNFEPRDNITVMLLKGMVDDGVPLKGKRRQKCMDFLEEHLAAGETVFVHCRYGQSRSAWTIMAYIKSKVPKAEFLDIWKGLREVRPGVNKMIIGYKADLGVPMTEDTKRARRPALREVPLSAKPAPRRRKAPAQSQRSAAASSTKASAPDENQ